MATAVRIFDQFTGRPAQEAMTLHLASETITVRELLRERLAREVEDWNARPAPSAYQGLVQPEGVELLLNEAKAGRKKRKIDLEKQLLAACEGFERTRILVLVDDRQCEELDEVIVLTPESTVTFLKLVPLVGG